METPIVDTTSNCTSCECLGNCPEDDDDDDDATTPDSETSTCEGNLCICGGYFSEEEKEEEGAMNSKGIMRISASNACPKCKCTKKNKVLPK